MNHLKLLFLFLVAIILIPTQQTGAQNTNLSGHIDWEGWSFDYSVGADFDGLAINDVTYKGIQIMGKGNFPAMPVYYNGNACGPYLDRLDTGLSPVTWANDALLVAREFTVGGEQWYEIGNRQFIGDYDIYQVWYFNSEGVIDAHLFSRGLQCNTFHVHYPHWRFDFDIAGASNDQILRQTTTGLIPYTTEFDVQATAAENHGWIVKDTLTNDSVSLQLDTGSWNVDGTIVPETAYSNNRVIGRAYNSGEADWTGSIPSNWGSGAGNVGYGNGENIDDTDIALWYAAYLPHSGSDGADLWHSTGVRISVNLASDFVYLLNPGNLTNYQGEQVIRQMVADTSQPPLTYAATGLPDGLTIDPNSGEVSGQVTTVASYETAVTVTDDAGESRSVSFTWQIDDLDSDDDGIPNATEQSFFSYTTPLAVIPPDGNSATQTIDLSAYDVSIGAQVDLSGIQANGDLNGSTEHFTLNINNGEYESSDLQTDVQCNGVTDLVSPVQTTVSVIDIGGGTPGIRLRGTSSAEVDDLNGCRSGIEYRLTVAGDYVNDSDGDGAEDFLDLDSDNDGALDVIEAGGTDADEDGFIDDLLNNQAVLLNPPDSDGDEIPDYLDLTSSGGVFDINGTPYAEFDTNGDGTIDNNDVEGGTDADNDGIDDTIDGNPNQFGTAPPAPNQPPVISPILDQITDINSVVNLIVSASDPEGDSNLTFEITGLPTDLSLENSTGTQATISGTATELGTSTVSVTVTDSAGESATRQFVWTIQAVEPPFSCTPGLLHERWEGIPGGLVSDLTSHSSYPSRPTSADVIDQFVTDRYVMDNYGVRVRGYLIAPETGTYRFWIASDDRGELWLSSDSDPANVALIGSVSGWTFPDEHDKYSGQRSAEINLIAGKRYYIEGLMKQYRGADHLTVWWETPSQARAFITSADACAFEISGIAPTAQIDASPTIGFAPLNVSLDAGNSSDSDGEIVTYQWDLGDGTSASGTTVNHSYGSPGVYHAVLTIVDNDGRTDTATVQITINVDPDDIG
ncbi:MAG: putative Ig domain-containing protein, partial [Candidatus Promineifilaceae bacterium]